MYSIKNKKSEEEEEKQKTRNIIDSFVESKKLLTLDYHQANFQIENTMEISIVFHLFNSILWNFEEFVFFNKNCILFNQHFSTISILNMKNIGKPH